METGVSQVYFHFHIMLLKEYATIYTITVYLTPLLFRIKADRIFSMLQTLL